MQALSVSVVAVVAVVATSSTLLAAIGAVNFMTNVFTSFWAYQAAVGGHPGQAKIYAGQDKLSDFLRDTNFHNKDWNKGTNIAAMGLDITEAVYGVIDILNGINTTWESLKQFSIKKTFRAICQPRNADGTFAGKPSLWNGLKSITSKINGKDMILGDLNVKNLSRFSKLDLKDKKITIGKLTKAISGIVSDFDSINEGDMTFTEFMLKRLSIGLDKSLFRQEKLQTKKKEDGTRYRKYYTTNFSTIVEGIRIPIDDIGIGKILIGLEPSGKLETILDPGSGLLGNTKDIITKLSSWLPPKIVLGNSLQATDVIHRDSLQGYSNVEVVKTIEPVVNICPVVKQPTYVLPKLQFNINTSFRYPYFNVSPAM